MITATSNVPTASMASLSSLIDSWGLFCDFVVSLTPFYISTSLVNEDIFISLFSDQNNFYFFLIEKVMISHKIVYKKCRDLLSNLSVDLTEDIGFTSFNMMSPVVFFRCFKVKF